MKSTNVWVHFFLSFIADRSWLDVSYTDTPLFRYFDDAGQEFYEHHPEWRKFINTLTIDITSGTFLLSFAIFRVRWLRCHGIELWVSAIGFMALCVTERTMLMDESKKWFDMWRLLFEVVSANRNIGLSLGVPYVCLFWRRVDGSITDWWYRITTRFLVPWQIRVKSFLSS